MISQANFDAVGINNQTVAGLQLRGAIGVGVVGEDAQQTTVSVERLQLPIRGEDDRRWMPAARNSPGIGRVRATSGNSA